MKNRQRDRIIREHILPWQIIRLYCQFTTPPKNKYFLIVKIEPQPLLFMVNSRIHPYVRGRAYLNQCQARLKANHNLFLTHDSYVDCREVCRNFSLNDIVTQMETDMRRVKGFISTESQEQVIAAIKISPVLEQKYKNEIVSNLEYN
ncbi:hypothetical protein [Candidatus Marithrix sp. Canyon 246]|uniref:hypothetical protein n=1 Tax=Candidatus Marithrix sp. Canyon 246 TaxID=1827136 RepID=UPI000849FCF6|nr:hypothetical protein [Candidatus Marithrix sp. Canyon 246]